MPHAPKREKQKKHDPLNILKLSGESYPDGEPKENRRIDPIYAILMRPKPREDETELAFFTDTSICTGCKACEVACKQWNQLKTTDLSWSGNSYDNTKHLNDENWRHVKFVERFDTENIVDRPAPDNIEDLLAEPKIGEWFFQSDQCKHCRQSPCQEACPTGAIMKNEQGGIYYQTDICMGCNMCVAACPFGVPKVSEKTGHSMKCTECFDRLRDGLIPACATACTTKCIQFGTREEMAEAAWQRVLFLHEHGHPEANLYGVEEFENYRSLNSFYLLMGEPELYGLPSDPVRPVNYMLMDYIRAGITLVVSLGAIIGTSFFMLPSLAS